MRSLVVGLVLAVLTLAEAGRLDLDAPVADPLPAVPRGVTARHLLNQTSGIEPRELDVQNRVQAAITAYEAGMTE